MKEKRGSLTYFQFQLPFDDAKALEVNRRPGELSVYFVKNLLGV